MSGLVKLSLACCHVSVKQRKSNLELVRRSWTRCPLLESEGMFNSLKLIEVLSHLTELLANLIRLANTLCCHSGKSGENPDGCIFDEAGEQYLNGGAVRSGEAWIQKRTGDRWLEVKKDLFREGGVRIPGSEETIQGPGEEEGGSVSGCVIRGERGLVSR